MNADGQKTVDDFIATRDEFGLFHMALDSGNHLAFAPSPDLEDGECALVDWSRNDVDIVPLAEAWGGADNSCFLMSYGDFEALLQKMLDGKLAPKSVN